MPSSHVIITEGMQFNKMFRTGEWKIFTGNELGALIGWWMLQTHKKRFPDIPLNKVYMIASTVSSMILQSMAKAELLLLKHKTKCIYRFHF